jgi:hypothetical protein
MRVLLEPECFPGPERNVRAPSGVPIKGNFQAKERGGIGARATFSVQIRI